MRAEAACRAFGAAEPSRWQSESESGSSEGPARCVNEDLSFFFPERQNPVDSHPIRRWVGVAGWAGGAPREGSRGPAAQPPDLRPAPIHSARCPAAFPRHPAGGPGFSAALPRLRNGSPQRFLGHRYPRRAPGCAPHRAAVPGDRRGSRGLLKCRSLLSASHHRNGYFCWGRTVPGELSAGRGAKPDPLLQGAKPNKKGFPGAEEPKNLGGFLQFLPRY